MNQGLLAGLRARDQSVQRHSARVETLIPIARELAHRFMAIGITVADVRQLAVSRGLLQVQETNLHWLGGVMSRAGLIRRDEHRRSTVDSTHGRFVRVWEHNPPECPFCVQLLQ